MSEQRTEAGVKRRMWPIAAGVAAALFGAGGYAVGVGVGNNDDGSGSTAGSGAAVAGGMADGDLTSGAAGPAVAPAAGGPEVSAVSADGAAESAAADSRYYGGYGRTVFAGSGFSTDAGTAAVYGFDAAASATADGAAKVAAVFGIEGDPTLQDGYWLVGSQDWTGPVVTVQLDGAASFSYHNPLIDPWAACNGIWEDAGVVDEADAMRLDEQYAECIDEQSQFAPSQEEADQKLREVLTSLGVDVSTVELEAVESYQGQVTRSAQARVRIEGTLTNVRYWLDLAPEGVYSFSGSLAAPVSLGEFPIVSAAEAFDRLSDPRFQAEQTYWPFMAEGIEAEAVWTPPTEAPGLPQLGGTLPWPITTVQLTSAELTLMAFWGEDSTQLQVPAYEFTAADGATYQVIAVAEEALDFAATP